MTLNFNQVNITTQEEIRHEFGRPYLDYLREMNDTYVGYADGKNVTSDTFYYKEIIEAMGGRYSELEYNKFNINWFYDIMQDLPWFEDAPAVSHYKNYVLVINNYEEMLKENENKKYIKYYIEYLENIVNWWTNEIITSMVGGPNARRNFTVLLVSS
ncbi:MAG: hypothetical protein LBI13_11105 [Streptococcaceae bacterium]|jgi:hypothetical protein|nr:hypothetical protein [Streptococcaceae bacterium]